MKINLECGNFLRNGYVNVSSSPISPENLKDDTLFYVGSWRDLPNIIAAEKAEEIICNMPVNTMSPTDFGEFLKVTKHCLDNKGILSFNFVDIRNVGITIWNGTLDLPQIHSLVLGDNNQFKSVFDTFTVKSLLESVGLTIESIVTDTQSSFLVSIEAKNA